MKIRLIPLFFGFISFMIFGDPAELAAYQKPVDSFEQKYPDVQVELIQVPGQYGNHKSTIGFLFDIPPSSCYKTQ